VSLQDKHSSAGFTYQKNSDERTYQTHGAKNNNIMSQTSMITKQTTGMKNQKNAKGIYIWSYDNEQTFRYPYSNPQLDIDLYNVTLRLEGILPTNIMLWGTLFEDVDLDGYLELYVCNGTHIALVDIDGEEQRWIAYVPGESTTGCCWPAWLTVLYDIDNDGVVEALVGRRHNNPQDNSLNMYFVDDNGTIVRTISRLGGYAYDGSSITYIANGYDSGIRPEYIADFNNDGRLEILSAIGAGYSAEPRGVILTDLESGDEIYWYDFGPAVWCGMLSIVKVDGVWYGVLGGAQVNNGGFGYGVNGTGTYTRDNYVYVSIIRLENGSEIMATGLGDGRGAHPIVGDVNGDSIPEAIFCYFGDYYYPDTCRVLIYSLDGSLLKEYTLHYTSHSPPSVLGLGDFDGDGIFEIVAPSDDSCISIVDYFDGVVATRTLGERGRLPEAINDFDGDGRDEILVRDSGYILVLNGSLGVETSYYVGGSFSFRVVDFDNDDINEIIVLNETDVLVYDYLPTYPWGDSDSDGIPNYLDIPNFDTVKIISDEDTIFSWPFELRWPVNIYAILPSTNYSYMLNGLYEWGVRETEEYQCMLPIVIELPNIGGLVDWLKSYAWWLIDDILGDVEYHLSSDGKMRLLLFYKSGEADLLSAVKNSISMIIDGLKDEIIDLILDFLENYDIELYTLRACLSACCLFDSSEIVEKVQLFKRLLFDLLDIILSICKVFFGYAVSIKNLLVKSVDLVLEILVLLKIKNGIIDVLKLVMDAVDPPGHRVVLELYNKTDNRLLLGYNQTNDSDISVFEHGIYLSGNDTAIMILQRNMTDYKIAVRHVASRSEKYDELSMQALPYMLTVWDPKVNQTLVVGGYIQQNETHTSTISADETGTYLNHLRLYVEFSTQIVESGNQVTISIRTTDQSGNPISVSVFVLINGQNISATEVETGVYDVTIGTTGLYGDYKVIIYTSAPAGYLPDTYSYRLSIVDTRPPYVEILMANNTLLNTSSPTAEWQALDNGSGIAYFLIKLDDGAWINTTQTSYTFTNIPDGKHLLVVRAVDKAGNIAESSVVFIVDTKPPTLTILTENGTTFETSSPTIEWRAEDENGIAYYLVRLDDGDWINTTATGYTFKDIPEGEHTVTIKAVDKAGNAAKATVIFNVTERVAGISPLLLIMCAVIFVVGIVLTIHFIRKRGQTTVN